MYAPWFLPEERVPKPVRECVLTVKAGHLERPQHMDPLQSLIPAQSTPVSMQSRLLKYAMQEARRCYSGVFGVSAKVM